MSYNLKDKEYRENIRVLMYAYGYSEDVAAESIAKAVMTYQDNRGANFFTHLLNCAETVNIDNWRFEESRIKFRFDNPTSKTEKEEVENSFTSYFDLYAKKTEEQKENENSKLDAIFEVIERLIVNVGNKTSAEKYKHFAYYYSHYTTFEQMSKKFSVSIKTLRTNIHRVREEVKNYLQKYSHLR